MRMDIQRLGDQAAASAKTLLTTAEALRRQRGQNEAVGTELVALDPQVRRPGRCRHGSFNRHNGHSSHGISKRVHHRR